MKNPMPHSPLGRTRVLATALAFALASAMALGGAPALSQPIDADPTPRWWKGNLHTHTLWSDGNDFPESVCAWYADHGYNFLALSDHNTLSQGDRWMSAKSIDERSRGSALPAYLARYGETWVETRGDEAAGTLEVRLKPFDEYRALVEERGRFIMIQAEEITGSFERRPIHINATNIAAHIPPQESDSAEETIRRVLQEVEAHAAEHQREVLVHLNHPNFGFGVTAEDIAPVLEERFFEVFNGHTGVFNSGDESHASTEQIWDIVNTIRLASLGAPPIMGIATDDSHSYHGHSNVSIPGRGWVMVKAAHLTPESLIRAMKAGDFYASSGVVLDEITFDTDSRRLTIGILAEAGEQYTTRFIGTRRGTDLSSNPVLDAQGNALVATRRYAAGIGEVLAEVRGSAASYTLRGDELYVRAVVESDAPPDRPTKESLLKRAWTQPVGWR